MCGILGAFGELEECESQYEAMLTTMKHRGPDERGMRRGHGFCLGHHRLSIVGLDSGRQPLCDAERSIYLVCNGEIYNNQTLRNHLCHTYAFSTQSDSEVIIGLYKQQGLQSVHALDGMFGFVLSAGGNYYVARDPLGIKPLYWGTDDKHVFFASEIKALVNHATQIKEFPNGYYFHSKKGLTRYYKLPVTDDFVTNIGDAVALIKETLTKSVRKRLMADVPVGVFLSGGLDSSIIAALMKEAVPELHSFSVGFQGAPDLKAAQLVADHLGTVHHQYVYSEADMVEVLPKVIYHLESFDPALVRSAIPCYFVSKLASQYVKVVLSGEGSDELFAGYTHFNNFDDPQSFLSESIRIISGLHNLNLQRVDRMTMAHGLEARVPFLDIEFVEAVLKIAPQLKMRKAFGIEKWLLRKAFEDKLPARIIFREKMEFAQGCGSSVVFEQKAACLEDQELSVAREQGKPVSTKEELFYYNIFREHFDHPDVANVIGRWRGELH